MAPLDSEDSTPSRARSPAFPDNTHSSSPPSFSKSHSTPCADSDHNVDYEPGFTSSLLARMSDSRTKFDDWVAKQRSRADAAREANETAARHEREEQEALRENLRRIRRQIGEIEDEEHEGGGGENVAERKEELLRQQAKVERSIANLHMGRRERQRELEDASREESVQKIRAEEVRSRKQQVSELKEQTVEDLTVGALKYRALGLTFTRSAERNSLRFSFVQIDREEPSRKFEFTLCVNGEEEWDVEECDPPLRAGSIMRLVDELNGEGDIGMFVRGMRKEFKAMV
eukprot:CAMPEP_0113545258 /NCGR_PEP_ID=MMETSP0015_2-20120614/11163_1 /TAXON_ID=2838 /ORGANISM="Odontella" /LENGTH=286 /DNA_ID=CAMNT_0000445607 /DNA_START=144 /DNA_END=1004 /DNA_ORIENTATION=+ /assembly_acc=CAM_ASM_000160